MTPRAQRRGEDAAGRPLLAGKLVAPSMPGRVMERPRLFERLGAGVERPVTLLAAPAGSGKTMLLTSWMSTASLPGPVAWLSLDQGDNDPVRFWTYLLAALCRSGALPDGSGLPALVPSPQGDDTLLPLLVHGLEELAAPVVLVLDDVHELTEPRVLQGIEFLVRHAPPQLRIVLSTRADPPLPLHRLLVSGRLTQLRGADLLRYQLRREAPNEVPQLHRRAARWYAGQGLPADAVQQAGIVRDWGDAAELIARAAWRRC
jgi:LuxR family maltose regulon positive regulatory protein